MIRYTKLLPRIQIDETCCWAASTSWWLKALSDQGRPQMQQEDIMNKFPQNWDKEGAMTLRGLTSVFREPKFMMHHRVGDSKDFASFLNKLRDEPWQATVAFPLIVGYWDSNAGGNHVAVLCEFELGSPKIITMDPAVGYRSRDEWYFSSDLMVLAWPQEAGYM